MIKYLFIELHINNCLVANKKYLTAAYDFMAGSKWNRCKWVFILVLCAELQTSEETVLSKPFCIFVFCYFTLSENLSSPCHSITDNSLLDIFPAIFLRKRFVPSSINAVN